MRKYFIFIFLIFLFLFSGCSGKASYGKVSRVVDGDTICVIINGREKKVRYIGVDTPETKDPRKPVERFGKEAAAFNMKLVERKTVKLVKDVSETDRYGRLLRYVYTGTLFVNAELVRQGYAYASSYPPDVSHQEEFKKLQKQAMSAGLGLWAQRK